MKYLNDMRNWFRSHNSGFTTQSSPVIIWVTIYAHTLIALGIRLDHDLIKAGSISGLTIFHKIGISTNIVAYCLFLAAILALVGLWKEHNWGRVWAILLLFPQYAILITGVGYTSIILFSTREVLSGVKVSFPLFLGITALFTGVGIGHTYGIIQRYGPHWKSSL